MTFLLVAELLCTEEGRTAQTDCHQNSSYASAVSSNNFPGQRTMFISIHIWCWKAFFLLGGGGVVVKSTIYQLHYCTFLSDCRHHHRMCCPVPAQLPLQLQLRCRQQRYCQLQRGHHRNGRQRLAWAIKVHPVCHHLPSHPQGLDRSLTCTSHQHSLHLHPRVWHLLQHRDRDLKDHLTHWLGRVGWDHQGHHRHQMKLHQFLGSGSCWCPSDSSDAVLERKWCKVQGFGDVFILEHSFDTFWSQITDQACLKPWIIQQTEQSWNKWVHTSIVWFITRWWCQALPKFRFRRSKPWSKRLCIESVKPSSYNVWVEQEVSR